MGVMNLLESRGAVMHGHHFVYTSGQHGSDYVNIDPLLPLGEELVQLARFMLDPFVDLFGPQEFDTIAVPATGAIALGKAIQAACQLQLVNVACVFGEKDEDGGWSFQRQGFAWYVRSKRVLVADDIVNTGGSAKGMVDLVRAEGGEVIGCTAVLNRGQANAETLGLAWPEGLYTLVTVDYPAYNTWECPHCLAGEPVVLDVGHGAEFERDNPHYRGGFTRLLD